MYTVKGNTSMRFFHISGKILNTLSPRIPNNELTNNGYEDNIISRVCFSNEIDGCLMAIGKRVEDYGELYVYEPNDYSVLKIVDNNEIVNNNLVPDAIYTGELWVLNTVKLKLLGRIKVIDWKQSIINMRIKNKNNKYREHGLIPLYWENI